MASKDVVLGDWVGGINNRAPDNRLPDGFVRDLLNLYPVGGTLQLRPGSSTVYSGTKVRGLFSLQQTLIIIDNSSIVSLKNGVPETLGSVPPAGPVCGAKLNDELYLSVGGHRLILNLATGLRAWGVDTPVDVGTSTGTDPQRTADQIRKGQALRRYALTHTNTDGVESGATAGTPVGASIAVPPPPTGHKVNLYLTELDGSVYYLQGSYAGGQVLSVGPTNAGGRMLMDQHVVAPPAGEFMAEANGVLVIGVGNYVFHTLPMSPHHVDAESGFFQYACPLGGLVAGSAGVYVSADKCYQLRGVGSTDIEQSEVFEYPAVPGSMTTSPTGEAVWVTEYGMAVETSDNRGRVGISEPSKEAFAPLASSRAETGVVEHNGERLLVSNNRQTAVDNPLAAAGYFESEVIRP